MERMNPIVFAIVVVVVLGLAGGVILVLIGAKILLEHLGIISF